MKQLIPKPNQTYYVVHRAYMRICEEKFMPAALLSVIEVATLERPWRSMDVEFINKRLGESVCTKTVRRALKYLRDKGYIAIIHFPGKRSSYSINTEKVQEAIGSLHPGQDDQGDTPTLDKMSRESGQNVQGTVDKMSRANKNKERIKKNKERPEKKECTKPPEQEQETLSYNTEEEDMDRGKAQDILLELLALYNRLPEKQKHKDFKGSPAKLLTKHGDRLLSVVNELGEDTIPAFREFLKDDYWARNGFSLYGFAKQSQRYAEQIGTSKDSEDETTDNTEVTEERYVFTPRQIPRRAESSALPTIQTPPESSANEARIVRRKLEAIELLRKAESSLLEAAIAEIGFKVGPEHSDLVESWHDKARAEFRSKFKREAPVVTQSLRNTKENQNGI